jgi:hypothetical protein
MAMDLSQRAMIVNLNISCWEGRKLDKKLSTQVADDNHAKSDQLRVNKLLISKDTFKDVFSARTALRTHVDVHTLPWSDSGQRVLMRNMFPVFMEKYNALEDAFKAATRDFIKVKYPAARAQADFNLGEAFNIADYPEPGELEHRFHVNMEIDAITAPNDFRVALDDDTVARIREQIQDATDRRLGDAIFSVWQRLCDVLEYYIARVGDHEAIFRDTTVTNLTDLINLLPGLNIVGDQQLRDIAKRLKDTVYQYEPKDLRKDEALRTAAAQEAEDILDAMKGFMNSMGQ